MKCKYLKILLCAVFVVVIYVLIFEQNRPTVMGIVTVTNKQLTTLKNLQESLKKANEKLLKVDDKYLVPLGFRNNSRIYPDDFTSNITLPVIVTYAISGQQDQVISFAKNIANMLPNHITFLYNIGLREYELYLGFCKKYRCSVINLNWELFPSYVKRDPNIFRPFIIQDALNKVGVIFYLESNFRIMSSDLSAVIEKAEKNGIIAWHTKYPTSAVTHPRMYEYFKTEVNNFYFLPAVDSVKLLIYNVYHIHQEVMFPWIKCALIRNCVYPVGSQDAGCVFNKKPLYRYSGCHKTSMAPLSVILGLHFHFDDYLYSYDDSSEKLFHNISMDDAKLELSLLVNNSTDSRYK